MCRGALIIAESPGGGGGYEEKEKKKNIEIRQQKGEKWAAGVTPRPDPSKKRTMNGPGKPTKKPKKTHKRG